MFSELRNVNSPHAVNYGEKILTRGDFVYNGPYFIACDHGCYHGKGTHGVAVGNTGCEDGVRVNRERALGDCLSLISGADYVFVWLDDVDAYGTIAEIGYAKALKKPIFLVIDERFKGTRLESDTWFIQQMATRTSFAKTPETAWESFEAFYEEKNSELFSMVNDKNDLKWLKTKITEYCNGLTRGASPKQLNELNRNELARLFIDKEGGFSYRFEKVMVASNAFIRDVEREIDYKIVRGLIKNQTNKSTRELQTWNIEGTGLIYQYKENYMREVQNNSKKEFVPKATEKQIYYIDALLNKIALQLTMTAIEEMYRSQAGSMIDSLLQHSLVPSELEGYVIPNPFIYTKTNVVRQVKTNIEQGFTNKMYDYLVDRFDALSNLSFYNGMRFSDEWIAYLTDELADTKLYEQAKGTITTN